MTTIRTKHFRGDHLDSEINDFIEDTPNIRIIDVKYCHIKEVNEYSEYSALLLYEVIPTEAEIEALHARQISEDEISLMIVQARQDVIGHTILECAVRASNLIYLERQAFVKACHMTFGEEEFNQCLKDYEEEVKVAKAEIEKTKKIAAKRKQIYNELLIMSRGRTLEECVSRMINLQDGCMEQDVLKNIVIHRFGEDEMNRVISEKFADKVMNGLRTCIQEVVQEVHKNDSVG